MLEDFIMKNWKDDNINEQASIEMWNQKADYFAQYTVDEFSNDEFIKIINENKLIDKNSNVLDVGCGAGKYLVSLADDFRYGLGIDLSPKMIEYANQKAEEYNIKNIEYRCANWSKLDIKKDDLYHKFDLVIACMTPAICSYNTFEKLIDCSKKSGIVCMGTRRKDSVSDVISKILKIGNDKSKTEENFVYMFNILWAKGYYPNIKYFNQSWKSEMTVEKAFDIYINRAKSRHNIDEKQEIEVKEFLNKISKNGKIYEDIETVKAVIYWTK